METLQEPQSKQKKSMYVRKLISVAKDFKFLPIPYFKWEKIKNEI